MCRRLLSVCALVALTVSPSAAAKPASSWAQAELNAVVAAGLMAREAAARPNKPLTKAELERAHTAFSAATTAAPDYPKAWIERGVVSFMLGDMPRAESETTSPGCTSRRKLAPMMSNAHVSEATQ